MARGFVPGVLDRGVIDEIVQVSNDDSFEMARKVARLDGVPVGISSGAALAAAFHIASRDDFAGKQIVAIIPSSLNATSRRPCSTGCSLTPMRVGVIGCGMGGMAAAIALARRGHAVDDL